MNTALLLLSKTALFIALMIPGYLLGKMKQLDEKAVPSACNILTTLAMPALILLKLIEVDFSELKLSSVLISLLLPLAVIAVLALVCRFVFRNDSDRGAMSFCSMLPNCGFLGIPLSAAMFPDNPEITVYVSLANVTATVLYLTLGIYVVSGDKNNIKPLKILLSPAVIASAAGIIIASTGLSAKLSFLASYLGTLSQITTPLAMIVLGFEFVMPVRIAAGYMKDTLKPALIRLILSPVLTVTLLLILKLCGAGVDINTVNAMFIAMALSPASSSPAVAVRYGGNGNRTAVVTVVCTVLCLITLPLLYLAVSRIF